MQKSWNRPDAREWAEVYAQAMPRYLLLIESCIKAQQLASEYETLDSRRS